MGYQGLIQCLMLHASPENISPDTRGMAFAFFHNRTVRLASCLSMVE